MLDIRWMASSLRSYKAVWQSYSALHKHFQTKACDVTCDSKDKNFLVMPKSWNIKYS